MGAVGRGARVRRRPAADVRAAAPARLLERRAERAQRLAAGEVPGYLPETADVRAGDWQVASAPADLNDRRCEITGPADRKMTINALNSGARVFMADLEDSLSPSWANVVQGQATLHAAAPAHAGVRQPRGQAVPARRAARHARDPPARLAPRRAPRDRGRRADVRQPLRLWPAPVLERPRARRPRLGAVLLPAQARVAPRGAAVERRLRARAGGGSASRAAPSGPRS